MMPRNSNPDKLALMERFGVSERTVRSIGINRLLACQSDDERAILLHKGPPCQTYMRVRLKEYMRRSYDHGDAGLRRET